MPQGPDLKIRFDAPHNTTEAGRYLQDQELETLVETQLLGAGPFTAPAKTRAKHIKELLLQKLGYSVPKNFPKSKVSLPAQNLAVSSQQSMNTQIWSEDKIPNDCRVLLLKLDKAGYIRSFRLLTGKQLRDMDRTKTRTVKLQARVPAAMPALSMHNSSDTPGLNSLLSSEPLDLSTLLPQDAPREGDVLPITHLVAPLLSLIGKTFLDPGPGQDRERGSIAQALVTKALGYACAGKDDGQFPDIPHQAIEVKLQLEGTIDLGKNSPNLSGLISNRGQSLPYAPKDVRYVIICGQLNDASQMITITKVGIVSGQHFYDAFPACEGVNAKVQIPLPVGFFDRRQQELPFQ